MIQLCRAGGFELAKWATSTIEFAKELHEGSPREVALQSEAGVLGMSWNPNTDCFHIKSFTYSKGNQDNLTNWQIISQITQVFDPTGLFAPVIVSGKMIIQNMETEHWMGCERTTRNHWPMEFIQKVCIWTTNSPSPKMDSVFYVSKHAITSIFRCLTDCLWGLCLSQSTPWRWGNQITAYHFKKQSCINENRDHPLAGVDGSTELCTFVKKAYRMTNIPTFFGQIRK